VLVSVVPSGLRIVSPVDPKVMLLRAMLTTSFAVPVNVTVAFWPGTVVVTVTVGPPTVAVTVGSAGTA
jgi:hypothetical protein